ncbi:hypothetical protein AB6D02_24295, partial [Vibrio splendidus]
LYLVKIHPTENVGFLAKLIMGQKQASKTALTLTTFINKTFNNLSHDLSHLNVATNHLTKNSKPPR